METLVLILATFLSPVLTQFANVSTQYGPIVGAQRTSALGKTYYSFQRIPYMKPPIGKLRFREAEIPDNWTTPLDCTEQGPRFPQIDFTFEPPNGVFAGDLDSMHINVYTNNLSPANRYPVLVWIHGGGFRTGSARTDIYGPDYMIEEEVVLVTFNYRLQAFGFLSLDDPTLGIPGNAGLKDQVLALKWVKQNIMNFGGDPQNITIFGQSSGGGCAHYHILSPASKDLFQRSIIMSGSAFNYMYAAVPRRNWALRLSRSLNYTGPAIDSQILEFLESADPEDIFTAVGQLMTPEESNDERLLNAFGPTIEPFQTPNAFMLAHPEKLAEDSWGKDMDILIGTTSFELGMIIDLVRIIPGFIQATNWTTFVPATLDISGEQRKEYGEVLKNIYYGLMEPTVTNPDGFVTASNEFAFVHSAHRVVKQRLAAGVSGKSYVYRFDTNSDNNCFSTLYNVDRLYTQPIHMDDVCHLFKPVFTSVPNQNSVGWNMTKHMVTTFVRFAATGDPGWLPSTGENGRPPLYGYNINENRPYVGELPEVQRMEVWDTFFSSAADQLTALGLLVTVAVFIKIIL